MSVWRREATELFNIRFGPSQHETIYDVFMTLLELVREAHLEEDQEKLIKIYTYAEWCSRQKAKDLWNAVGVSFYEHLIDYEITYNAIPYWIKPEILLDIKGLLKWRISDIKTYEELIDNFNKVNGTQIEY